MQRNEEHRLREKNKNIIIDIIRILMCHDDKLKKFLIENDCIHLLFWFIENENIEQIIFYSILTLRYLLYDEIIAKNCVNYGGVNVLTKKLSHGSPRVLLECSKCLSAISDVDILRENPIFVEIDRILQLLGSSDAQLVKHLIGFLGNIASANQFKTANPNKEYLVKNNALESLIRIFHYNRYPMEIVSYEIIENCIFALKNLTANFSSNDFTNAVRKKVIERLLDSELSYHLFKEYTFNGFNSLQVLINIAIQSFQMNAFNILDEQNRLLTLINNALLMIKRFASDKYFYLLLEPISSCLIDSLKREMHDAYRFDYVVMYFTAINSIKF
ncbi:unnamed protein product [Dracunculus medinensis]|uniref:Arm_2 domain-containing protein n=1 Tax=Dracunculus medinensis TaxID=318479 RepID=A0A0N4UM72_DRAME|nr:unnamed protein product [Dracunculus medinensis]